jgi:hypothetical protein
MTSKIVFKNIFLIAASLIFLFVVVTKKEQNWLYYSSLLIILGNVVVGMIASWRSGKKRQVKTEILKYGLLVALMLLLTFIFDK